MNNRRTVLEGCEVICIRESNPPTDLIACPLSKEAQLKCTGRRLYQAGLKYGLWLFAWWKDGTQYVGTSGKTLKEAYKELGITHD